MYSRLVYVTATSNLMKKDMRVYWIDFLGSFSVLVLSIYALMQPSVLVAAIGFVTGVLASYRCGSFMHEIVHFSKKDKAQRAFRYGWNLLFGIPMLTPSVLYDSHLDHHSTSSFGTPDDPEYVVIGDRSWLNLAHFVLVHTSAPIMLVLLRTLIAPLLWVFPKLNERMGERGRSQVINWNYLNTRRGREQDRFDHFSRAAATLVLYGYIFVAVTGIVPLLAIAKIVALVFCGLTLNGIRTLVAHRYDNFDEGTLDKSAQLTDSINLIVHPVIGVLFAPVGLRFHALHHLVPTLPYHNLALAHARLMEVLPADDVYRTVNIHGLRQAFVELRQNGETRKAARANRPRPASAQQG